MLVVAGRARLRSARCTRCRKSSSHDNAEVKFTFIARGAVEDGERIVAFTARPQDPALPMIVQPQSGLHVRLNEKGWVNEMDAEQLLRMIHHHVRHTVIGRWFEFGHMPTTLAVSESSLPGRLA